MVFDLCMFMLCDVFVSSMMILVVVNFGNLGELVSESSFGLKIRGYDMML